MGKSCEKNVMRKIGIEKMIQKHIREMIIFLLIVVSLVGCTPNKEEVSNEYMVFIGDTADEISSICNVGLLVIDAEYFTSDEIEDLKKRGIKQIYSYLNIGSVERFRPYYQEFEEYTFGEYENWPEERWIDVSRTKWQVFVKSRVDELSQKGIDGFFVDNADVYYMSPREEIYNGIVNILDYMKADDKKVILNGGDTFVRQYFKLDSERVLFDGVNQEGVYTQYDLTNNRCGSNSSDEREYYTEYLDMVLAKGYQAYSLEYATDSKQSERAYQYAKEHNYICYVANNVDLKLERP